MPRPRITDSFLPGDACVAPTWSIFRAGLQRTRRRIDDTTGQGVAEAGHEPARPDVGKVVVAAVDGGGIKPQNVRQENPKQAGRKAPGINEDHRGSGDMSAGKRS